MSKEIKKEKEEKFILWFSEIGRDDAALVGGKNASLGEMYNKLPSFGVRVPPGFAITTCAYEYFILHTAIKEKIEKILSELDQTTANLDYISATIKRLILRSPLPDDLGEAIGEAYAELERKVGETKKSGSGLDVAVRSSALSEDRKDPFAGQLESFLNIRGEDEVLDAVRKCFASNFLARAIDYRKMHGYSISEPMAVVVQKMVRSDKAFAGVALTVDRNTGFHGVVVINAGFGLGPPIVEGEVNSDEYIVSKHMLKQGFKPIIGHTVVAKEIKRIYDFAEGHTTKDVPVSQDEQLLPAMTNEEILNVAKCAIFIEEHYGEPMDVEFAQDGLSGELCMVQARAVKETEPMKRARENKLEFDEYILDANGVKELLRGVRVCDQIVTGKVRVIASVDRINEFKDGEILVTQMTKPDWQPIMHKEKTLAIVTDDGSRNCHAAIVASNEGIPCIVGTGRATKILRTGQIITVDCSRGEIGFVYDGAVPFHAQRVLFERFKMPKTELMLFVDKPLGVFEKFRIPNRGVGLARTEFVVTEILNNIHPMAWVRYPNVSKKAKEAMNECAFHYSDKAQYFTDKLAEAWGRIATTFYPSAVIMRFSDFKSNEYGALLGGEEFEPQSESNPMMGLRGATRYLHASYQEAFRLECLAMQKAREEFGFKNIIPMVPFCRTPEEGRAVLKLMKEYGLERGVNGLQVYMMTEIPSNVFLADEFAEIFDGFSIGSNDLTQLVFGVDRDSGELAGLVDENHEGLRRAVKHAIDAVHKKGRKIGICGEGPSKNLDFAKFLVECGIDSITITSGSLGQYQKTAEAITRFEEELGR